MATIATKNEVITVIIIFTVEPERQQELIDTIAEFLETVKQQPGFVSTNIHQSIDGTKVANYAQWKSHEDYQGFINNTEVQKKSAKIREFKQSDIHIYEVAISKSKSGTPKIKQGQYITNFDVFRTLPENQPRMIELAEENVIKAMELPGLISANFHRSLDGTRVINYGQWQDRKSIKNLEKQPEFSGESKYWEGVAEAEKGHYLYEVVLTIPND